MEPGIAAHIILTQLFMDQHSGVLLTVQDNAVNDALPFRLAVNLPNPGHLHQVLDISSYVTEQAAFTLVHKPLDRQNHFQPDMGRACISWFIDRTCHWDGCLQSHQPFPERKVWVSCKLEPILSEQPLSA